MTSSAMRVRASVALRVARARSGTPMPYRRKSATRPCRVRSASKRARIAGVHSAEWTTSARTVSGHKLGYSARMEAARWVPRAVAALVAHVTVRSRASLIGALVVSDWNAYGVSNVDPLGERATFPPSSTTSGLAGHCRWNGTDVRL